MGKCGPGDALETKIGGRIYVLRSESARKVQEELFSLIWEFGIPKIHNLWVLAEKPYTCELIFAIYWQMELKYFSNIKKWKLWLIDVFVKQNLFGGFLSWGVSVAVNFSHAIFGDLDY